jgi:hypothetical protein
MIEIKNELQHIIFGNEQIGNADKLKTVQNFLRGNAEICYGSQDKKSVKREEKEQLLNFASAQNLYYSGEISEEYFVAEGAEQKVYWFNDFQVIKINGTIFYETWLDYFNNLLIHNYFFSATAYEFMGFAEIDKELYAVVRQNFIIATEPTNLNSVKLFLEYNGFSNTRNNDYYNAKLGIIFEDLHDENVLSRNEILFFVDTIFYLTETFFKLFNKKI